MALHNFHSLLEDFQWRTTFEQKHQELEMDTNL